MELTQQQAAAAKACGCTFVPATEVQVHRLAMQRRIFTLDGMPFVVSRDDDGFLETHATLTWLIEAHGRDGAIDESAGIGRRPHACRGTAWLGQRRGGTWRL